MNGYLLFYLTFYSTSIHPLLILKGGLSWRTRSVSDVLIDLRTDDYMTTEILSFGALDVRKKSSVV